MPDVLPAPEVLLLNRFQWDYFCTLTFAPTYITRSVQYKFTEGQKSTGKHEANNVGRWYEQKPEGLQVKAFHSWINGILHKLKITRDNLYWVRRWEKGYGGRMHFHALLKFHNPKRVNINSEKVLQHLWAVKLDMGHADVRVVEKMGYAAYITKVQNAYEQERFTPERFRTVEFSKSAQKTLRRLL